MFSAFICQAFCTDGSKKPVFLLFEADCPNAKRPAALAQQVSNSGWTHSSQSQLMPFLPDWTGFGSFQPVHKSKDEIFGF